MKKCFKDLLTGVDNETQDFGRWLGFLAFLAGVFYQGWDVMVNARSFSMQDFGIGVGALAAGTGVMLKLKENTEPQAKESHDIQAQPKIN